MINNVVIEGYVSYKKFSITQNGQTVLRFSLACYKNLSKDKQEEFKRNGKPTADYITCVAFNNLAQTINTYVNDNSKIIVIGSINSGKYVDSDGNNKYITQLIINQVSFASKTKEAEYEEDKYEDLAKEFNLEYDETGLPIVDCF